MRRPKSAPDKRRRLTQREESAVALIALRMVVAEREWNPGDAPVVRMLDMMFRVLEYQIAAKAFGAWLTRLGIQTLRRGGRKLVVVPVNFDEAEAALRKLTGSGHTLASAVKQPILEQAAKTIAEGSNENLHRTVGHSPIPVDHVADLGVDIGHGQEIPPKNQDTRGEAGRGAAGIGNAGQGEAKRQSTMGLPPTPKRKPLNDWLDSDDD